MTAPSVCAVAQQVYEGLPPAWTAQDADNGFILLSFCDALVRSGMQPLADYGLDKPDGTPGWATLFNGNVMTARIAQYIGQFVGVVVPAGLTDSEAQALIASHPGYNRGRPSAIIAAVQATLTGSQQVNLLERDTSAWHATVQVYASQMPNEAATLAAIAAAKPAADIIALQVLTGPTYGQIQTALAPNNNYGARLEEFPTYGDIQNYVPGSPLPNPTGTYTSTYGATY